MGGQKTIPANSPEGNSACGVSLCSVGKQVGKVLWLVINAFHIIMTIALRRRNDWKCKLL